LQDYLQLLLLLWAEVMGVLDQLNQLFIRDLEALVSTIVLAFLVLVSTFLLDVLVLKNLILVDFIHVLVLLRVEIGVALNHLLALSFFLFRRYLMDGVLLLPKHVGVVDHLMGELRVSLFFVQGAFFRTLPNELVAAF